MPYTDVAKPTESSVTTTTTTVEPFGLLINITSVLSVSSSSVTSGYANISKPTD